MLRRFSGVLGRSQPEMADRARPVEVAQLHGFARLETVPGRALSPHAQRAGRPAAFARAPRGILERKRPRDQARIEQIGLMNEVGRLLGRGQDVPREQEQGNDTPFAAYSARLTRISLFNSTQK